MGSLQEWMTDPPAWTCLVTAVLAGAVLMAMFRK